MSAAIDFGFNRVWTLADLAELPDELHWRRVEIVDGVLVVSPQPASPHAWVVDTLFPLLAKSVPAHLHVSSSFGVEIGRTYRVPDLLVVQRTVFEHAANNLSPSQVVLAVEVESPSSVTTDRITKPAEYASGGIPHYWRIEPDPLRLHVYRSAGDVYELVRSWDDEETVRLIEPFEVEIDLGTLSFR